MVLYGLYAWMAERWREKTKNSGQKDEVWLLDAINYMTFGNWDQKIQGNQLFINNYGVFVPGLDQLRELAYMGELDIQGEDPNSGLEVYIPKDYWRTHRIEHKDVLRCQSPETLSTSAELSGNASNPIYSKLRISKSDAINLWGGAPVVRSIEQRRKNWKGSQKCIERLKNIRPEDGKVEITIHDKPSFVVGRSLEDAFRRACWQQVKFSKSVIHESPLLKEGIELQGASESLLSKIAGILEEDGLPQISRNARPDGFNERNEIKIRVGIQE